MFTLETRINGALIEVIRVFNTGLKIAGRYCYFVECHRFSRTPLVIEFDVLHKREEGADGLSLCIYKRLYDEIKKYAEMEKGGLSK